MAFKYQINGQMVEFQREPTEADIDEAATQLPPKDPFLPGEAIVEQKTSSREDLLRQGLQRGSEIPTAAKERGLLPAAGQAGLAGLETVGGLFQRAESALALPALMATFKSNKSVILSSTDDTSGLFGGKNSS